MTRASSAVWTCGATFIEHDHRKFERERHLVPRMSAGIPTEWPPGSPRILIVDGWLANAGDGAIALATASRVRQLAQSAAVLVAAYQGDRLQGEYPGLTLVPPLAALLDIMPGELDHLGWAKQQALGLVLEADGILSQGGGFLYEHYEPISRLVSYDVILKNGLPLAFCGQSVGMFHDSSSRALLVRALREAVAVSVRDRASLEVVAELSGRRDVVLAADQVFTMFRSPPKRFHGRGLGLVLTEHPLLRADGSVTERSLAPLSAAVERLTAAAAPEWTLALLHGAGTGKSLGCVGG